MTKLWILLVVAFVSACKGERAETKTIACPYYWSAEKDGKTTHLLGTIHGGVDAAQLPRWVWADLERAPAVAVETDIEDPALMAKAQRPSPSLRDELGPAYWQKLEKAIGAPTANAVASMKPFVAVSVVMLTQMPRHVETAMDAKILATGKAKGKRIVFLETLDSQLAVVDKHLTERELKLALDDLGAVRAELAAMVNAYEAGDEAALVRAVEASEAKAREQGYTQAEVDEARAALFDRRNQAWIAPLEELHASGGGFVAVGAGHLVGAGSVPDLLAKRGYTVARAACPRK